MQNALIFFIQILTCKNFFLYSPYPTFYNAKGPTRYLGFACMSDMQYMYYHTILLSSEDGVSYFHKKCTNLALNVYLKIISVLCLYVNAQIYEYVIHSKVMFLALLFRYMQLFVVKFGYGFTLRSLCQHRIKHLHYINLKLFNIITVCVKDLCINIKYCTVSLKILL